MLPSRSRESHSRVHSARIMMRAAYKQERDTCLLNLTAGVLIQLLDDLYLPGNSLRHIRMLLHLCDN